MSMEKESSYLAAPFHSYLAGGTVGLDLKMDPYHHQDLMDRHYAMLSLLKETAKQVQDLRQENVNLKMVNADLTNRLAVLLKAMTSDTAGWFGYTGGVGLDPNVNLDVVLRGMGMMKLGSGVSEMSAEAESPSPTSVMDSGRTEGDVDCLVNRVSLPKSISVRSNGYLRTVQSGAGSSKGRYQKQKVVVPGAEKEKEQLHLEVYNQGMLKTELCNKWQETGACPYGDQCQFAHGINELRPVLRHPRYKTEVCRMVLNGDPCPYGHRCHFRHTLTDQEKIMKAINLRSRKAQNW